MKELLLRTATGISLIILVIGSILLGPVWFLLVILLIFGLASRELYSVYTPKALYPAILTSISAGALIPMAYLLMEFGMDPYWLILPGIAWLAGYFWSGFSLPGLLSLSWLSFPFTTFLLLGWLTENGQYHPLLPLSVIALVWVNDTFAYVSGSLLGRHLLTPRLSPGKTWEGFLGGLVFTLIGGWVFFKITGEFSTVTWLTGSLLVTALGLSGDLFESSLKRKINVKNMGGILPGHGGILDRFDSLLFVSPVILILLFFLKLSI